MTRERKESHAENFVHFMEFNKRLRIRWNKISVKQRRPMFHSEIFVKHFGENISPQKSQKIGVHVFRGSGMLRHGSCPTLSRALVRYSASLDLSKFGKSANLSGVWCVGNRPSPKRFEYWCRRFRQEVRQGGSNSTSYLQPPLWEKIMPAVIGNNPTDFGGGMLVLALGAFSPVGLEVW